MTTKTTHYTLTHLERLGKFSGEKGIGEVLLREALDDLLIGYKVSEVEK